MIKVGALTGVLVALGALGGMGADGCEAVAWLRCTIDDDAVNTAQELTNVVFGCVYWGIPPEERR